MFWFVVAVETEELFVQCYEYPEHCENSNFLQWIYSNSDSS